MQALQRSRVEWIEVNEMHYIIYFNQQWVGDHSEEWFRSRGDLARAAVAEMKTAGVLVFAAGVDQDLSKAFSADQTSGELRFQDGRYSNASEYLGGLTIVDVPDRETAKFWAGRIAIACGWPQEIRPLHV